MNDKMTFIAFVLEEGEWGRQLLRYAFEHPMIEYYGEPEEQAKLKEYFKKNHYIKKEPLIIEQADIVDYMLYVIPKKDGK